jgi:putative Mg2+ transporter-C (MgtC) family protein
MISVQEIILRLLLGALIGGIIGFEREIHGRAAGFRTQLIVCVASVLIMIISENFYYKLQPLDSTFRIDPARIAASALIGVGFLGAGVIIKSGFAIRGLTTAASIWVLSAIGLAIGAGFYIEAIATAFITIFTLVILRRFEGFIKILFYKTISVSTEIVDGAEEKLTKILTDHGIHIRSVDYEKSSINNEIFYTFSISTRSKRSVKNAFTELSELDFVKNVRVVSWDNLIY